MSKTKMAKANWRPILFNFLTGVYMCLIVGIPSLSALALFRSAPGLRDVTVILLPMEWSVCFVTVADLLSLPHQFAVKPGKYRRDVSDRRYFHRRLYGLCWTAVYYNKPVYFLSLSVPSLKWLMFRIFGYSDY